MKFPQAILVSLAASALLAGAAMAQPDTGPVKSSRLVSFGVGGGMSVPVSDAGEAFKNGINAQAFVRFNPPTLPVMPRLDLSFSQFDLEDQVGMLPGTGQILAGLANMQLFVMPVGPIRPYVTAGLGAYNLKTEVEGAPSLSDTKFGINGGAGVVLKLGMVSGYLEGRVDNVFTDQGMIDTQQVQVVPVTFGIVF